MNKLDETAKRKRLLCGFVGCRIDCAESQFGYFHVLIIVIIIILVEWF